MHWTGFSQLIESWQTRSTSLRYRSLSFVELLSWVHFVDGTQRNRIPRNLWKFRDRDVTSQKMALRVLCWLVEGALRFNYGRIYLIRLRNQRVLRNLSPLSAKRLGMTDSPGNRNA